MTFGEMLFLAVGVLVALLAATILFSIPKDSCSTGRVMVLNFSAQTLMLIAALAAYVLFRTSYKS